MAEAAVAEIISGAGGIAIGAGLAMGLSTIGAGMSQSALGSSAMGVAAERPEFEKNILIYVAIPELLAIFGFIVAFLLLSKI